MKTTLAAAAVLLAAGCSHYVHRDPAHDFDTDYYDCQKEAAPQNHRRKEMIDRCLRLKGWELEPGAIKKALQGTPPQSE